MKCLFCRITKGEVPSYKIYEDDKFFAFLDIMPVAIGHILLVPKTHIKDLISSKDEFVNGHIEVIKNIETKLKNKLNCQGLTIITNNNLGQEVPHLHWHLIPRYSNDKIKLPPQMKVDLEKLSKKLA